MTSKEKYERLLAEHGNSGLEVIMPGGQVLGLHEQNGGYSTLFDENGVECFEVDPEGDIYNGYTAGFICRFNEVIATGELAPWFERADDGSINFKH
jgi:hypothetical protein